MCLGTERVTCLNCHRNELVGWVQAAVLCNFLPLRLGSHSPWLTYGRVDVRRGKSVTACCIPYKQPTTWPWDDGHSIRSLAIITWQPVGSILDGIFAETSEGDWVCHPLPPAAWSSHSHRLLLKKHHPKAIPEALHAQYWPHKVRERRIELYLWWCYLSKWAQSYFCSASSLTHSLHPQSGSGHWAHSSSFLPESHYPDRKPPTQTSA